MRRKPTDAERKLWYLLRSLKPLGMHFRRQAPIGPYVADFAWLAGKLVVELDGSQHAAERKSHDDRRTAWLQSQGYRLLRFWNNDVLTSATAVGEMILAAAQDPTPGPSPQGGGEKGAAATNRIEAAQDATADPAAPGQGEMLRRAEMHMAQEGEIR